MTDESAILIDWHMYWQSGTLIGRLHRLYVRKIDWEKEEAPVVCSRRKNQNIFQGDDCTSLCKNKDTEKINYSIFS